MRSPGPPLTLRFRLRRRLHFCLGPRCVSLVDAPYKSALGLLLVARPARPAHVHAPLVASMDSAVLALRTLQTLLLALWPLVVPSLVVFALDAPASLRVSCSVQSRFYLSAEKVVLNA